MRPLYGAFARAVRYLLKVWILKGKTDEMYRAMWERAMDEMIEKLVRTADKAGLTYVAEMHGCVTCGLASMLLKSGSGTVVISPALDGTLA